MKTKFVFEKITKLTPFIAILVLSLLPVFYTWGRLPVWGDTIIYFNSAGLEKYLYQWLSFQNGQYFAINYYPFFLFYKFIELFIHDVYIISTIILFLLKAIAGLGIYRLSKLLYSGERQVLYVLSIVFYLLSPALLNASHYLYIYSFAPWFIYFIFKIIKYNQIKIQDLIWLSVILFFSSVNLPNPKYIFHLFVIAIIIFIASLFFRLIKPSFFIKNFGKIIIFFLLLAYLFIPQIVFVSYYSSEKYDVHIKSGYKDTGQMMDFGYATLSRMFKLHKDTLNLNAQAKENYNSSEIINLLSYLFVALIITNFIFSNSNNNRKKYNYLLLILIIVYLFFAIGSNPPFGFLYQFAVESFSPLAFLRTTAGATFFLSVFYALLLFSAVLTQKTIKKQNLFLGLLIIAFGIVGYPILSGETYKNVKVVSPNTDITKRGIIIPQDYFDIQGQLDLIKIDAKVLYPTESFSYITTNWGYFGVPIYDFIYNTNNVDCINIKNPLLNNIGFVFLDKSSLYPRNCPLPTNEENIIKQTDIITLSKIPNNLFLPHFYTSKNNVVFYEIFENISSIIFRNDYQIRSAVFFKQQNEGKDETLKQVKNDSEIVSNTPILELKKIDPTKYRIRVHAAKGDFPLVFSESFHEGWKNYLVKPNNSQLSISNDTKYQILDTKYRILDGNEEDQATKDELAEYISKGWVTDLGDGKEKTIKHNKWEDGKEKLDYVEKYNIDFISKNFQDTIQNDNLPSGNIFETWFSTSYKVESGKLLSLLQLNKNVMELPEENHLLANGYANSWIINTEEVCKVESYKVIKSGGSFDSAQDDTFCVKNPDGTYDFELVIEFWPQRLFYLGLGISGATLLLCLGYLGWDYRRRRKSKGQEKEL